MSGNIACPLKDGGSGGTNDDFAEQSEVVVLLTLRYI
jgi:hypothetical protein